MKKDIDTFDFHGAISASVPENTGSADKSILSILKYNFKMENRLS
jgi:hypothetical protein